MRRIATFTAAAALTGLALALAAGPAQADRASLFGGSGQRPGPDVLYAPPAEAPQLTNGPGWSADPILISGASAYRGGEFLYQDFLYDDHGAKAAPDPADPRGSIDLFSKPNGTYTYPTAAPYASNAADLVELRVRTTADATVLRLTLNTLNDPELVGATIAIGSSPEPRALPHGANVSAPAERFLTWHGRTAELVDAATGAPIAPAPTAKVDTERRQVELTIPRAAWDPGRATHRLAAGVGLWDKANDAYLLPAASATAATPGGAGGLERPAAFFNVAFRATEPLPQLDLTALTDPAWWRDRLQGAALAANGFGTLHADVDFAKLADGVTDESGVPRGGVLNRILASRFSFGDGGVDWSDTCAGRATCTGEIRGNLQPYAIYVPGRAPDRGDRYQLTLLLHSLSASYNQFSGSDNQRQFGERAHPSIVVTPEGRGPDGFYNDIAGADTFEVWADVARHYRLDPRRTSVAGYSMGGYGTLKFVSQYPDLFARAQPTVGALQGDARRLASARWVPILMWNAVGDELVAPREYEPAAEALKRFGYRYELDQFAAADPPPPVPTPNHLLLALNDQFAPAARFLGSARVVRNPPRVTLAYDAALDFPRAGTTADHAYWVSKVRPRRKGRLATIDVRSHGYRSGTPRARDRTGSGALTGGLFGPLDYASERTTWGRTPRTKRRDRLTIRATNVASVTIDARRARISCRARRSVDADGPLRVRLVNCR